MEDLTSSGDVGMGMPRIVLAWFNLGNTAFKLAELPLVGVPGVDALEVGEVSKVSLGIRLCEVFPFPS